MDATGIDFHGAGAYEGFG
jgi:hypothetical protein